MTIENAIRAKKALNNISCNAMPARVAYKISKLDAALKSDEQFYSKRLSEIVNEYCEKNEDGTLKTNTKGYIIQNDKLDECTKAMTELRSVEVTVPEIAILLSELDGVSITPEDISCISDFIKED